ncbi:MAG: hypothetical protein R3246_13230 [Acidimicrobiia bacterium]|nr:hypothetical protein [Acidimicrobiia bacterium]
MGIDACLKALGDIDPARLAEANRFMASRMGDQAPTIHRYRHYPDPWGSIDSEPSIEIRSAWRFYGRRMARGPWPLIHEMIVTARAALPEVEWGYLTDINEGLGEPVTDELLADLWSHWLDGPDPHHGYYDERALRRACSPPAERPDPTDA